MYRMLLIIFLIMRLLLIVQVDDLCYHSCPCIVYWYITHEMYILWLFAWCFLSPMCTNMMFTLCIYVYYATCVMNSVVNDIEVLIYIYIYRLCNILDQILVLLQVWCSCKICKECWCKYVITRCINFECKYMIYDMIHYFICVY